MRHGGLSTAEPVWEPVEVFSAGHADLIAIAKSILMDAVNEFVVKGARRSDGGARHWNDYVS